VIAHVLCCRMFFEEEYISKCGTPWSHSSHTQGSGSSQDSYGIQVSVTNIVIGCTQQVEQGDNATTPFSLF